MATAREPQRVSAAEFIRGFANWRLRAARRPVVVTHHGKDAHVLISLDDYRRLDTDPSEARDSANLLRDAQADLFESIRDGAILIDRQWRVAAVNPAASDMLEAAAADLIGVELTQALPRLGGSLLSHHLIRMIDHRERFSGDVPDLIRPGQWLRIDLVPHRIGGALVVRDVGDTVERHGAVDAQRAMADAVAAHGAIGWARLSVRETVEDANEALIAMVGADAAAIRRVRFSALLLLGQRQAFAEALEAAFRSRAPQHVLSEMMTREGTGIPVTLAIADLRGPYASDGALVVVTRRADG